WQRRAKSPPMSGRGNTIVFTGLRSTMTSNNLLRVRGPSVPSAAFTRWQNDRMPRLNEVDAHCAAVLALVPPNPTFLVEALRGFVLHLCAHLQGFCRDLYTECSQIWIAAIPVGLKATAQAQFFAQLALEKGTPSHDNI